MALPTPAAKEFCFPELSLSPRADCAATKVVPAASPAGNAWTGWLSSCPIAGVATKSAAIHANEKNEFVLIHLESFC